MLEPAIILSQEADGSFTSHESTLTSNEFLVAYPRGKYLDRRDCASFSPTSNLLDPRSVHRCSDTRRCHTGSRPEHTYCTLGQFATRNCLLWCISLVVTGRGQWGSGVVTVIIRDDNRVSRDNRCIGQLSRSNSIARHVSTSHFSWIENVSTVTTTTTTTT